GAVDLAELPGLGAAQRGAERGGRGQVEVAGDVECGGAEVKRAGDGGAAGGQARVAAQAGVAVQGDGVGADVYRPAGGERERVATVAELEGLARHRRLEVRRGPALGVQEEVTGEVLRDGNGVRGPAERQD